MKPPITLSAFSVTCGVVTKSAHDWGMFGLKRRLVSQAPDILTFNVGADYDADLPFEPWQQLAVAKDGVQFFVGTVMPPTRHGSGEEEYLAYEVKGPWYWLEEIQFKMPYLTLTSGGTFITDYSGHLLLNWKSPSTLATTGEQIQSVLLYAVALSNAPIGIGTIDAGIQLPLDEIRDTNCAEIIKKQMRWMLDCVTWFDYSQSPPVLHIRKKADLVAKTVAVGEAVAEDAFHTVEGVELSPRHDLRRPAVCITYEGKGTYDGKEYVQFVHDFYPPTQPGGALTSGREPGAVNMTIEMNARTTTFASMELFTEKIDGDNATDADRIAWWKRRVPWLARPEVEVEELLLSKVNRKLDSQLLPNEIRLGSVAPWMGYAAEQDQISARVKFKQYDKAVTDPAKKLLRAEDDYAVTVSLNTTDAPVGASSHKSVKDVEEGDAIPPVGSNGLAAYMFNKLDALQHSGEVKLTAAECGFDIGLGNTLNIAGGRAEWATMNALIEECSEDIDQGKTALRVGPAKFLSVQSIIELAKLSRPRRRWSNPATMASGGVSSGKMVLGKEGGNTDTVPGKGEVKEMVIRHDATNYIWLRGSDPIVMCDGNEVHLCNMAVNLGCCKWA